MKDYSYTPKLICSSLSNYTTINSYKNNGVILGKENGMIDFVKDNIRGYTFQGIKIDKNYKELSDMDDQRSSLDIRDINISESTDNIGNLLYIAYDNKITVKSIREKFSTYAMITEQKDLLNQLDRENNLKIKDICYIDNSHKYPISSLSLNFSNTLLLSNDAFNVNLWDCHKMQSYYNAISVKEKYYHFLPESYSFINENINSSSYSSEIPELFTKCKFIGEDKIGVCYSNSTFKVYDINTLIINSEECIYTFNDHKKLLSNPITDFKINNNLCVIRSVNGFVAFDIRNPSTSLNNCIFSKDYSNEICEFDNYNICLSDKGDFYFGSVDGRIFTYNGQGDTTESNIIGVEGPIKNLLTKNNNLYCIKNGNFLLLSK